MLLIAVRLQRPTQAFGKRQTRTDQRNMFHNSLTAPDSMKHATKIQFDFNLHQMTNTPFNNSKSPLNGKPENTNIGTEGTTAAQLPWRLNLKCQHLMKIKPKMPMPQCFTTWNGQHCSQWELVTTSWLLNSEQKTNHPEQPRKQHLQLSLQINTAAKITPSGKEQGLTCLSPHC